MSNTKVVLKEKDLYWLAGILEGEGTFAIGKRKYGLYPMIRVQMADKDVIKQVHGLVDSKLYYAKARSEGRKPLWSVSIHKKQVVKELLELILPIMGERRTRRIKELLLCY